MDGKSEDFKHELKRITRRIYHTNLARTKMTETENQENRKAFTFVPNINERSKEMMNQTLDSNRSLLPDRLMKSKRDHEDKVKYMAEQKEKKVLQECSFKPNVNQPSSVKATSQFQKLSEVFNDEKTAAIEDTSQNLLSGKRGKISNDDSNYQTKTLLWVNMAFSENDCEKIEIIEGEDINMKIEGICKRRGINDKSIMGKILDLVKNQIRAIRPDVDI